MTTSDKYDMRDPDPILLTLHTTFADLYRHLSYQLQSPGVPQLKKWSSIARTLRRQLSQTAAALGDRAAAAGSAACPEVSRSAALGSRDAAWSAARRGSGRHLCRHCRLIHRRRHPPQTQKQAIDYRLSTRSAAAAAGVIPAVGSGAQNRFSSDSHGGHEFPTPQSGFRVLPWDLCDLDLISDATLTSEQQLSSIHSNKENGSLYESSVLYKYDVIKISARAVNSHPYRYLLVVL